MSRRDMWSRANDVMVWDAGPRLEMAISLTAVIVATVIDTAGAYHWINITRGAAWTIAVVSAVPILARFHIRTRGAVYRHQGFRGFAALSRDLGVFILAMLAMGAIGAAFQWLS